MGFFDNLKKNLTNQVTNTVNHQASQAISNGVKGAADAIKGAAKPKKTKTFTFTSLPTNVAELQALPQADLKDEFAVAALTVLALDVYGKDRTKGTEMLNFLKGPQPLSQKEISFLNDRFMDGASYIPRSFFKGATPDNDYAPTAPFTIDVMEQEYSRDQQGEGYVVLWLQSGGADSPREVKLRNKPSTGQWFLWEQMLLSGIRKPKSTDAWA